MTTTAVAPATSTITAAIPTAPTTWVSVAEGLWVGSSTGEFRGTIEFVDGRFETSDDRGTRLGHSHSLAGAKLLVDAPQADDADHVLLWTDERTVLALGWLAFGAAAIAAVSIASQFFI